MRKALRVVVAGMLAGDPHQGGATWATLQWVLGFDELHHAVTLIDPVPDERFDRPDVRRYFDRVVQRFGLRGRSALVAEDGRLHGMTSDAVDAAIDDADVLVNLSGRWRSPRTDSIPRRVYVDLDPAFTQLWHAQGADVGMAGHTHFVTVGTRLADPHHPLHPRDCDTRWSAILPPVVLSHWPRRRADVPVRMTTVANWRSYGSIAHDGAFFGQKAHSFRELADLPRRSPVPLDVALSIHPGDHVDRDALVVGGWRLLDAATTVGDPDRYAAFVRSSWAEIGIAKLGYVVGRTGWVSDRTACYLASGRPAVLHDTELCDVLPVGDGVLTFSDVDEAVEAIAALVLDYESHAEGARSMAGDLLDARKVLGGLLTLVGGS